MDSLYTVEVLLCFSILKLNSGRQTVKTIKQLFHLEMTHFGSKTSHKTENHS